MKTMYAKFKGSKYFPLILAIVSIALGILCMALPQTMMSTLVICIGIGLILVGSVRALSSLIKKEDRDVVGAVIGAVIVVLGIIVLAKTPWLAAHTPALLGILIIISAISLLLRGLALRGGETKIWIVIVLTAIVVFVLGLIILINPKFIGNVAGILCGIGLLINGVSGLLSFFGYNKSKKTEEDK